MAMNEKHHAAISAGIGRRKTVLMLGRAQQDLLRFEEALTLAFARIKSLRLDLKIEQERLLK